MRTEVQKKRETPERREASDIYRQANKEANKGVAISKAQSMDKELDTSEGERKINRIGNARDKSTNYFRNMASGFPLLGMKYIFFIRLNVIDFASGNIELQNQINIGT